MPGGIHVTRVRRQGARFYASVPHVRGDYIKQIPGREARSLSDPLCVLYQWFNAPVFWSTIRNCLYEDNGAQVLGINVGSVPTQMAFDFGLANIPSTLLLSDFHPKGQVSKEFEIYNEDRGASDRGVFIIDANGKIRYREIYAKAEDINIDHLLKVLKNLS